jgi:hypothetical protein
MSMPQLFETGTSEQILGALKASLDNSNENPFWAQKTLPFAKAILDVLLQLREQNLLFSPEGTPQEKLTIALFLSWCDLFSLKGLAFVLQKSNQRETLVDTKYSKEEADSFSGIDLEVFGGYLASYSINLEYENVDFPITHYNLHNGITDVIKSLVK